MVKGGRWASRFASVEVVGVWAVDSLGCGLVCFDVVLVRHLSRSCPQSLLCNYWSI